MLHSYTYRTFAISRFLWTSIEKFLAWNKTWFRTTVINIKLYAPTPYGLFTGIFSGVSPIGTKGTWQWLIQEFGNWIHRRFRKRKFPQQGPGWSFVEVLKDKVLRSWSIFIIHYATRRVWIFGERMQFLCCENLVSGAKRHDLMPLLNVQHASLCILVLQCPALNTDINRHIWTWDKGIHYSPNFIWPQDQNK